MIAQHDKAEAFAALHQEPGAFVIPNPWDAGSARILQYLGFQALATTSAGFAFAKGKPDEVRALSREEVIANVAEIVGASVLPVSADLQNGYGDAPEDCALTITWAAQAGAVGGSIEDASGDPDAPIYPVEFAAERIQAAAEAARKTGIPFMLTARAENYLNGRPDLADTIARLQAYQEAGADVLFAPGVSKKEEIAELVRSLDRPVNVIMGGKGIGLTVEDLSELGVKRISIGSAFARTALAAFMNAAREVQAQGTFQFGERTVPFAELNQIFAAWSKD
ncbi:MAG: oxaloacetate decarboxylase [Parvibaculaceae bacterium]